MSLHKCDLTKHKCTSSECLNLCNLCSCFQLGFTPLCVPRLALCWQRFVALLRFRSLCAWTGRGLLVLEACFLQAVYKAGGTEDWKLAVQTEVCVQELLEHRIDHHLCIPRL